MNRRTFLARIGPAFLAVGGTVEAQSPGPVYRIGFLITADADILVPLRQAFLQGLRDLGYADSQIVLLVRDAGGRVEQLPPLVDELLKLKVNVIVASSSTPAALAAKRATTEVPIVAVAVGAPVATGLVSSIARPGGNVTGSTILGTEVAPKRLELAKALRPGIRQIALLWNPDNPANAALERELRDAAPKQSLKLTSVAARTVDELDPAFGRMARQRTGAVLVTGDTVHQAAMNRIISLAARHRVPAIYNQLRNAVDGGLMAYAADDRALYRRAAVYVDKILKGTKPGDLPFEQATEFDLVINLKTARDLGLTIPRSLLVRATRLIE